jgi:glycosyltransferase involved in cell wall biosynthesis
LKNQYKLSVVVLVYNTEQYLRDCLDSLVNQTLKDIEIILVNDSSPDNSHIILEEYRKAYKNITVINQKNSGGAVAGNNGMRRARGEYVTVMDSDDIVPLDAYEKLYKMAKEIDADIVIGKPNILINGIQKEIIYKQEREVWKENRVIENLNEFLDIFYDGFYWNKIFKRELIYQYDCFMPPGMLYADRPMVHKAFLYAKKITIITDIVYLWRKRGSEAAQKSITQMNGDIDNLRDRLESLHYQIDYFEKFGDKNLLNEFLKRNIDRLFFPIHTIVSNKEFRELYLTEVKKILSRIENVYDNDLGIKKNLYVYFILHDMIDELISYLTSKPNGKIIGENGKFYWTLPYFRDKERKIPDELFRIRNIREEFIKINAIHMDSDSIIFNDIRVPLAFQIDQAELIIQSRFNIDDIKSFKLQPSGYNHFDVSVSLSDFQLLNIYDIYLSFSYDNRQDKFRISKKMLENQTEDKFQIEEGRYSLYFTNNEKLSLRVMSFEALEMQYNDEKLSFRIGNPSDLGAMSDNNSPSHSTDSAFSIYFKDRMTKEKIYFQQIDSSLYELKWNYFIEGNSTYDLYFKMFEQEHRLNIKNVVKFSNNVLSIDDLFVELYKTDNNNISIKTYTQMVKFLASLKKLVS